MRIMGLDVGDKTIGVAMSDQLGWTAQGVEVIKRKKIEMDLVRLREIIDEYQVEEIVVGLPKNMDGTIGPRAEKIMEFAEVLKSTFNLPLSFWDERLTTISAEKTLIEADISRKKRKQVIDKMAAMLILQGYLDNKG
ncbi:Holliday junction DNA helicase RuvA [Vulcanibacillus modesticaldus]|uniref:Putative pre-16S rRNA nuclease n=1 Tax=Vulcanibacillus modesticaldus TaxID=337097 RepID=A0A1D2YTA2_9BACI|nr:Holliday junction resolvase RuvX [Vulcanibacillus modesticaldus]OEF98913.1 Holliday junction DNA helicase RuvA [Vulcanibacillus modesticaldus]